MLKSAFNQTDDPLMRRTNDWVRSSQEVESSDHYGRTMPFLIFRCQAS
jgi:hypothetical protein